MDQVLMLCYFFPPLGGGGVQRSSKFAKYLPDHGWAPVVVAARPNPRNRIEQGLDRTLERDLPPSVEVIRCGSFEFAGLYAGLHRLHLRKALFELERLVPLLHMDYKIGWYLPALRAARRLVQGRPIRALYTSSPPYAAHLLGARLQEEYGLPWIADFRDPWTQMASYSPPTGWHARLEHRLERRILSRADFVIANTPENREKLITGFGVPPNGVATLPNGFDPEDFGPTEPREPARFVISCVGKLYETAAPEALFRGYRAFSDRHPDVYLRLVGWRSRRVAHAAARILREGTWEEVERVPHDRAIDIMQDSALLLANLPNERATHWVPAKLYEYLAARRPILLVGPQDGDAADILRATGAGSVAPNRESAIEAALERCWQEWRARSEPWRSDEEAIARFDRRRQAGRLAEILRTVSDSRITPS